MKTLISPSASSPTTAYASSFNPLFSRSMRIELLPCKRVSSHSSQLRCNSSIFPGGPGSGDNDSSSRSILDAFFLGKAVAEAINERIESTVGEFLSAVGRLQAEQQKQVQEFQEEVLERAKKAKEQAAREAVEAQGLVSKSVVKTTVTESAIVKASDSAEDPVALVKSTDASETDTESARGEETSLSSSSDDE